ncbi:MAG: aldose 1-epimerase family protein [Planctomycetota bacterium]|nr:aldose 1-epimerase family protein [Planctomycetota bacterium]
MTRLLSLTLFTMASVLLSGANSPARAQGPEPYRKVLTDAEHLQNDGPTEIQRLFVTPACPHAWTVRKVIMAGGKQDGVELVIVDNGTLQIVLCPTRGMGIIEVRKSGQRFGWLSPVSEIVHPKYVNLQDRGGLGWLSGFNEFMCRCGLENNGGPGPDTIITNTGEKAEMALTLHGKIANIPASKVEVEIERQAPWRIRVKGVVHERMFLGPKLELRTVLETEAGSAKFTIKDTVINHSAQPQEFEILYHANIGRPVLGAGAKILLPAAKVSPINARAAEGIANWEDFQGPTNGYVEQVYCIEPRPDALGRAHSVIHNAAGNLGVTIDWMAAELPFVTLWKNTAAEADGYVTGIEPGTNFPRPRKKEREKGRVPSLAPGAMRSFTLDFGFLSTKAEVDDRRNYLAPLLTLIPKVETEPEQ